MLFSVLIYNSDDVSVVQVPLVIIGIGDLLGQAADWLQGSVIESGVGGGSLPLPFPEEEVTVDGNSLAILQRRRDVT